jgi:hypothetical protein
MPHPKVEVVVESGCQAIDRQHMSKDGVKLHGRSLDVAQWARTRVTCRCRRCNAGNVWKVTCKNLYSHVVVLALPAGHGTLRVTAGTATCSCK